LGWPYLWNNFFSRLDLVIGYYKTIGSGTPAELSSYLFHGWNLYPLIWTVLTTQIPILMFWGIGLYAATKYWKKHSALIFLAGLWAIVPLLRASWPGVNLYGGIRQFMEFLPALSIFSGFGAQWLWTQKRTTLIMPLVILALLFATLEIIFIHPNQNVYFNQFIGGLSGAKDKKIPYWGNSYGNAYQQGVDWLNKNAEKNAKLSLPISNMVNIPRLKLRPDIDFSNAYWSGTDKKGEYEMELYFDYPPINWYRYAYLDNYLNPIYEAKVDGVPILKIWKNDLAHTKSGLESEQVIKPHSVIVKDDYLLIDLGQIYQLARITINHGTNNCFKQSGGYITHSLTGVEPLGGNDWIREDESIDHPQVATNLVGIDETTFVYLFAAKSARYILLDPQMKNSCLLNNPQIEVRVLKSKEL
jgi:hypothetical protein